jgi:hypothetical protein
MKGENHRHQSANVQHNIEELSRIRHLGAQPMVGNILAKYQMAGRRNGQKFSQALEYAQQTCQEKLVHAVSSYLPLHISTDKAKG